MSIHDRITSDEFSTKMKDQTTVTYQTICNHSDVTCNDAMSEKIKAAIGILKSETMRNIAQVIFSIQFAK